MSIEAVIKESVESLKVQQKREARHRWWFHLLCQFIGHKPNWLGKATINAKPWIFTHNIGECRRCKTTLTDIETCSK